MQAAFEKIIEKLEEEKMSYFLTIANTGNEKLDYAYEQVGDALDKAIEIVKKEEEVEKHFGWLSKQLSKSRYHRSLELKAQKKFR